MGRTTISTGRGAVVTVCALGILAGPAVGGAYAQPEDKGDGPDLETVRRQLDRLHDRAEKATEAYNAAEEKAKKQQKAVDGLEKKVDALRDELDELHRSAGAMARAQYRSGGIPETARLMLQRDPEKFLHDASVAHKGRQATKGLLGTLTRTRKQLDEKTDDASAKWHRLEADKKRRAAAKKKVEGELEKAQKVQARLAKDELKRLRELEDEAAWARQSRWLKSGVLGEIHGKPSKAGKRALAYAANQIGKDYQWGAEGPATFDCSGLTMRAWQSAGEDIPRTSQEQWKQLKHVPIEKMRPGDLIIYKHDASHVAMYAGDGKIVQAPRTGRQISVSGAGSMPILGVVRPDA